MDILIIGFKSYIIYKPLYLVGIFSTFRHRQNVLMVLTDVFYLGNKDTLYKPTSLFHEPPYTSKPLTDGPMHRQEEIRSTTKYW